MTLAVALLMGWLFERTRGSVLLAIVAHFSANVVNFAFPMRSTAEDPFLTWLLYFWILLAAGLLLIGADAVRATRASRTG